MPGLQYWFTGGALAAFLALVASISALGFAWYTAARSEMDKVPLATSFEVGELKTAQVRELLERAISSGTQLIGQLPPDQPEEIIESEVRVWGQRTRDLIAAAYGQTEAALFLNDSGYTFFGGGRVRSWIDGRLRRLTELLQRIDGLTVRKEFDATKFL